MIEYRAPSGSGLQYAILQQSFTLTNIDLKSLNTSPYTLINIPSYIGIINCTLQYFNITVNTGQDMYIGYESLLGASLSSYQIRYQLPYIGGNRGVFTLSGNMTQAWTENTLNDEPLVLWQQSDDSSANYTTFKLIITYIAFNI